MQWRLRKKLYSRIAWSKNVLVLHVLWKVRGFNAPVPEIIDPVFAKTSQNARFLLSENERFGLVFVKIGSINSGTDLLKSSGSEIIQQYIYQSISELHSIDGYLRHSYFFCLLRMLCSRGGNLNVDWMVVVDHVFRFRQHFLPYSRQCCSDTIQYNTKTAEKNFNTKYI